MESFYFFTIIGCLFCLAGSQSEQPQSPFPSTVQIKSFQIHHTPAILEDSAVLLDSGNNVAAYKIPSYNACLVLMDLNKNPQDGQFKFFNISDNYEIPPRMELMGEHVPNFCDDHEIFELTDKPFPEDLTKVEDGPHTEERTWKRRRFNRGRSNYYRSGCGTYNNGGFYGGYPYNYGGSYGGYPYNSGYPGYGYGYDYGY